MATGHQSALRPPMFVSARLMAAVRLDNGSTIHIQPSHRDTEDRTVWRYIIEDNDHQVLDDATDLRSGTGDHVDAHKTMATLLGFLGAAAESYRHTMTGQASDNADLFPPDVTEWAYEHDDELAALALELEPPDGDTTNTDAGQTPAEREAIWHQVWSRTGCADCAGAAAQGRPWGPDHCWATHRPHEPIERRTFNEARKAQGFVSQEDLDAFYAYYDHFRACIDCGRPGPPFPLDDGMQPTASECPTGRALFEHSIRHRAQP